jgi:hypothetical protein
MYNSEGKTSRLQKPHQSKQHIQRDHGQLLSASQVCCLNHNHKNRINTYDNCTTDQPACHSHATMNFQSPACQACKSGKLPDKGTETMPVKL